MIKRNSLLISREFFLYFNIEGMNVRVVEFVIDYIDE
jgi:hypothetical protein